MHASCNKRAEAVYTPLVGSAVMTFGWPFRVRFNKGGENVRAMILPEKQEGRASLQGIAYTTNAESGYGEILFKFVVFIIHIMQFFTT